MVSKLVPALALILLAGPVLAADAPASSGPSADAKASSTTHAKKHKTMKKHKAASSAPAAK